MSEKTGTAFLVIHHAGKGAQGKQGPGGADDAEADLRKILRGSSAIFDACGNVLVSVAQKGEDAGGVRLSYKTIQQVNPPREARAMLDESVHKVVEAVNRHAGKDGIHGKEALRELAGLGAGPCRAAIETALGRRLIRNAGTASRPLYFPATPPSFA